MAKGKRAIQIEITTSKGDMEAMNKRTWPKAKYVMRRDGSLLTLGDLPSVKTIRWVISRKTIVVEAVRGGLISLEDACRRYSLTLEEFSEWKAVVERRASDRRRSLPKRDTRVQQSDTAGPPHHS